LPEAGEAEHRHPLFLEPCARARVTLRHYTKRAAVRFK
jgi:hypothetical protein